MHIRCSLYRGRVLYILFYLFEPVFDWSFIYVFYLIYLYMFITFLNEDVGWFMYIRLVYYLSVSYELSVFDVRY